MSVNGTQLKSALWEAANILRGSAVDRTDWKGYILPLLFFKRICDVWDEETAEAKETFGDEDPTLFPEVHRFQVPEGCHWRDVRETPANVGTALLRAMQEIEKANPDTLYRVFGTADWGNREKFPDELIKDLIEGFSSIPLGNADADTDLLGDAYEYLVGKFADVTRRNKAGEFYTPRSVVRMMIQILDPREGESIYDPACGTGGMLLGAIEHVARNGGDPRTFFGKIYGQEKNLTTSSIARMNLVLHGVEDYQVAREDTLRNPAFSDASTGGLLTFDCVIANPPFSLKEWGRDVWEADPWGRAAHGLPPKGYGDYAFVQPMIASMADGKTSRMAVVLPQGALFRKAAQGKFRTALRKEDPVEAVTGPAPHPSHGTPPPGGGKSANRATATGGSPHEDAQEALGRRGRRHHGGGADRRAQPGRGQEGQDPRAVGDSVQGRRGHHAERLRRQRPRPDQRRGGHRGPARRRRAGRSR